MYGGEWQQCNAKWRQKQNLFQKREGTYFCEIAHCPCMRCVAKPQRTWVPICPQMCNRDLEKVKNKHDSLSAVLYLRRSFLNISTVPSSLKCVRVNSVPCWSSELKNEGKRGVQLLTQLHSCHRSHLPSAFSSKKSVFHQSVFLFTRATQAAVIPVHLQSFCVSIVPTASKCDCPRIMKQIVQKMQHQNEHLQQWCSCVL